MGNDDLVKCLIAFIIFFRTQHVEMEKLFAHFGNNFHSIVFFQKINT